MDHRVASLVSTGTLPEEPAPATPPSRADRTRERAGAAFEVASVVAALVIAVIALATRV